MGGSEKKNYRTKTTLPVPWQQEMSLQWMLLVNGPAVSAGKGKMPGPVNITNYNNNARDRFYFFFNFVPV